MQLSRKIDKLLAMFRHCGLFRASIRISEDCLNRHKNARGMMHACAKSFGHGGLLLSAFVGGFGYDPSLCQQWLS